MTIRTGNVNGMHMKRRQVLATLAAALVAGKARADAVSGPFSLLVAGTDGGAMARWGNALAQALSTGFPNNPAVLAQTVGGLDGVTGANQLDTQVMPDGKTAALVPSAALFAFLTGDSRVHFDPTHWTPVLAGATSGVLVVRGQAGSPLDLDALKALAPLRIAADTPQGPDLAALLAVARLGITLAPTFGLRGINAKAEAFNNGAVDAVFLFGENTPAEVSAARAAGAQAVFCLGTLNTEGAVQPDPLFPDLPDALAYGGSISSPLDAAYQAAAAAARLDFSLVLPHLTDPDSVALWADAATNAAQDPAFSSAASASGVALQAAAVLANALPALSLSPADQDALQSFLAKALGWQPD
jgi:hypothetical protein